MKWGFIRAIIPHLKEDKYMKIVRRLILMNIYDFNDPYNINLAKHKLNDLFKCIGDFPLIDQNAIYANYSAVNINLHLWITQFHFSHCWIPKPKQMEHAVWQQFLELLSLYLPIPVKARHFMGIYLISNDLHWFHSNSEGTDIRKNNNHQVDISVCLFCL